MTEQDLIMDSLVKGRKKGFKSQNLKKVPFVEFFNQRLQGVISSGSSVERVYVTVVDLENKVFTCHTNNNRPCGGLRVGLCKHLKLLLKAGTPHLDSTSQRAVQNLTYQDPDKRARYPEVFARFQSYLRYLEIDETIDSIPEMHWFIT